MDRLHYTYKKKKDDDTMTTKLNVTMIRSTEGNEALGTPKGGIYLKAGNKNGKFSMVGTITQIHGAPIVTLGRDNTEKYYGCTMTLTLTEDLARKVATDIEGYFERAIAAGSTDPKVAVVIETNRVGIPVPGINPRDGKPGLNLVLDQYDITSYCGVERGDDTFDPAELLDMAKAVSNARSAEAYLGAASRKVAASGNAAHSGAMAAVVQGIFAGFGAKVNV